jgi:two-component system, cell cycle sensor histidine kinase and response regulator CckA
MRDLIDLNAAITHFAERLRPKAGDRTSVRMELDPSSGKIAAALQQVDWLLVNLVADAYDGMPGGGELTITTANVELNPTSAAEMELSPGAYVQMGVTAAAGAMDIGASTRKMVRQMHGAVSVQSTCRSGVVIGILLPRFTEAVASAAGLPREPGRPASTVLLVSDNSAARGHASDVLRKEGYQVLEAAHRLEAESILAAGEVNLMITDIVSPEQDGLEKILSLRAIHPGLKIIAVSESPGVYLQRMAKLLGADSVMSRPLTRCVLCDAVREQIGEARWD